MEMSKIIINGIFYVILTSMFIYLWVKEKEVVGKVKACRDRFSQALISKLNIQSEVKANALRKTINFTETIGSALILVLIIQRFYLGNFLVPTGSMIPTIVPKDRLFGNMVIYKFKKPEIEDIIVFKEPMENKVLFTKRLMGEPGDRVRIDYGYLFINDEKVDERAYVNAGAQGSDTWIIPKKGDKVKIVPGDGSRIKQVTNISLKKDIEKIQQNLLNDTSVWGSFLPDVDFYINGEKTGPILDYLHDPKVKALLENDESFEGIIGEDYYLALGDNTRNSLDSRSWGFVAESRIRGKAFVRFWPLNRIGLLK